MFVYWLLIMTSYGAGGGGPIATVTLPTKEACVLAGNQALRNTLVKSSTCVRVEVPASQKQFLTMAK